ncbi:MAG: hypothetical protein HYS58_00475, partial [Elusimicrobia bacterium]|nr:hypothetical protein [Elusimicrobiota bacterium]
MADSEKPLQGQVVKPPLLETVLAEQQCLTAVDKFSQAHDQGFSAEQGKYYKALVPGALPGQGQQFAFEVDLDACSGCKACVTGCHNLNGLDGGETWRAVGLIHGESEPKNLFRPATLTSIGLYPENLSRENPPSQTAACKTPSGKQSDPPVERLQGNAQYNPSLRTYFQQNITTACHHCADPSCLNGCPV